MFTCHRNVAVGGRPGMLRCGTTLVRPVERLRCCCRPSFECTVRHITTGNLSADSTTSQSVQFCAVRRYLVAAGESARNVNQDRKSFWTDDQHWDWRRRPRNCCGCWWCGGRTQQHLQRVLATTVVYEAAATKISLTVTYAPHATSSDHTNTVVIEPRLMRNSAVTEKQCNAPCQAWKQTNNTT